MPGVKEKFSAALGWVIDRKKIKQKQLAAECGLSSSSIADYKTGRREGREDVRKKIAQALGLGYEDVLFLGQWILDGKNPDELWLNLKTLSTWQNAKNPISKSVGIGWRADKPANAPTPPITGRGRVTMPMPGVGGAAEMLTRVPLISFVQAGDWSSVVDNFQPGDAEEWIPFPGHIGPHAFALRVNGPSMEPKFVEGDIIFVDPDREAESGDFIIAKNGVDEATFKKFYRDGDRCFLVPLNEDWGKPMEMTGRDWEIVGRVMGKLDLF